MAGTVDRTLETDPPSNEKLIADIKKLKEHMTLWQNRVRRCKRRLPCTTQKSRKQYYRSVITICESDIATYEEEIKKMEEILGARGALERSMEKTVDHYQNLSLVVGGGGVGKSHLVALFLKQRPPSLRVSTPCAEASPLALKVHGAMSHKILTKEMYTKMMMKSAAKEDLWCSINDDSISQEYTCSATDQHLIDVCITTSEEIESLETKVLGRVIDVGGQPQLLELLPRFISHVSLGVVVTDLSQDLADYPICYFYGEDGKPVAEGIKSNLTNEQIICVFLQMIKSLQKKVKVMIVGTHRDVEHRSRETREQKEAKLRDIVTRFGLSDNIIYTEKSKIIFAVNALHPEANDHIIGHKIMEKAMSEKHAQLISVPIKHHNLELTLKSLSKLPKDEYKQENTESDDIKSILMQEKTIMPYLEKPESMPEIARSVPGIARSVPRIARSMPIMTQSSPATVMSMSEKMKYLLETPNTSPATAMSTPLEVMPDPPSEEPWIGRVAIQIQEVFSHVRHYYKDEESLKEGLRFLHQSFRIFYFDEIPDLVFGEPQLLLNFMTKVTRHHLQNTKLEHGIEAVGVWKKFTKQGIIGKEVLERICEDFDEVFTSTRMIEVMEKLKVICEVGDDEYLMPSLLTALATLPFPKPSMWLSWLPCGLGNYLSDLISGFKSDVTMLLHFPLGLVRFGVYCSTVCELISKHGWKIAGPVSRNRFYFTRPHCAGTVALIDSFDSFIIVNLNIPSDISSQVLADMCSEVRDTLLRAIYQVTKDLGYSEDHPIISFICKHHYRTPHAAECNKSHEYLLCTKNNNVINKIEDKHLLWLKVSECSAGQHDSINESSRLISPAPKAEVYPLSLNQLTILKWRNSKNQLCRLNLIKEMSPEWKTASDLLGLAPAQTTRIEMNYHNIEDCCREVMAEWLIHEDGTYNYLRNWKSFCELLKDAKLSALAKKICDECLPNKCN